MNQAGLLSGLSAWYTGQCDDDWEHRHGIRLETMDDPGWWLRVSLAGTDLEDVAFDAVSFNEEAGHRPWGVPLSEQQPWYSCKVVEEQFVGMCDPTNLTTIIGIFLKFASDAQRNP